MTSKPPVLSGIWTIALAAMLPAIACAQVTPPRPPARPPPTVIVQPPINPRFQQTLREHQVRDRLQKNQLEEQLRQNQIDAARRPYATDAARAAQLEQADQARRELYRARQQDVLDRYQSAVAPPVVHPQERRPAAPRSSDGAP